MQKENPKPTLLWIACLLLGVSLLTACGRKGPPLPPLATPQKEGAPVTQPEEEKEKPPEPQVFDPQQN